MSKDPDCLEERSSIFITKLYEEKNMHKTHRFSLVQKKLFFIGALFGLGAINYNIKLIGLEINLNILIYLVPIMAIAYDIFIFAEDFKVKRIGEFIRDISSSSCEEELDWELYVNKHREALAKYATYILTFITFLTGFFFLKQQKLAVLDNFFRVLSNYIDSWILSMPNPNDPISAYFMDLLESTVLYFSSIDLYLIVIIIIYMLLIWYHNRNMKKLSKNEINFKVRDNKGEINVESWKDILPEICSLMADKHKNEFEEILKLNGNNNIFFSKKFEELKSPKKIDKTDIFMETNLSKNTILILSRKVLYLFGYSEDDISFDLY